MKLDPTALRYLSANDFKVLNAVELAMKNHELVSVPLAASLSKLPRPLTKRHLSTLLKHKLIAHDAKIYDGYKLTYLGYDFLALRTLVKRGHISGVGMRMGVGKESDIHICQSPEGRTLCLKLHRLGRISFRSIKRNRDYLQRRQSASWMYLARLAALKEFAYMKALYAKKFPVPEPIDVNRHVVVMSYIDATPFAQVRDLGNPHTVLEKLMRLIVRFAKCGLIHGDFNEFNLMIDDDENITVIDFPQIISISHANAEFYFQRDVQCVCSYFQRRFRLEVTDAPSFCEVVKPGSVAEVDDDEAEGLSSAVGNGGLTTNEAKLLDDALGSMKLTEEPEEEEERSDDDVQEEDGGSSDGEGEVVEDGEEAEGGGSGEESKGDASGTSADELSGEEEEEEGNVSGMISDVWRPRIRRPNITKVKQKARRKQRAACGGGHGNAGKSKTKDRRKGKVDYD